MSNEQKKLTITAVKERLLAQPSDDELRFFAMDERAGVQKLLTSYYQRQEKQAQIKQKFAERLSFEQEAWAQGFVLAGVDEVGRGPLAGPVVAAAVVIDESFDILEVHDSKQLSLKQRNLLAPAIKEAAVDFAFGVVSPEVIDEINIYEASRVAMKMAIEKLKVKPDGLLIDAMVVDLPFLQEKLIKGDDRSISIGAASILAKVYRDELMAEYDLKYPGYGFAQNAGYGTKAHLAGLAKLGITPIHRKTFAPVKKYITD